MCMGYAKDIKAWACPQEVSRRDAAIGQWAEMWLDAPTETVEPKGLDVVAQGPQVGIGPRPHLIRSLDKVAAPQEA